MPVSKLSRLVYKEVHAIRQAVIIGRNGINSAGENFECLSVCRMVTKMFKSSETNMFGMNSLGL